MQLSVTCIARKFGPSQLVEACMIAGISVPIKQALLSKLSKSKSLPSKHGRAFRVKQGSQQKYRLLVQAKYSDKKDDVVDNFALDNVKVSFGNIEPREGASKDSSRKETTQRPHSRWWYGKDGELESTFPCPDCRGRGYIVCPLCDIATPDSSCTECHGKGLKTCSRCLGKRAILLQPVYEEIPWEDKTARGPLLEIEDDVVIDNMDIHVVPDRKSKRIYSSPTAEVREKIRQALKSLDARTGSVTRRMRRIHNDPVLNAKRIAAIKKAKSTEAARKHTSEKLRLFFQEPRNRMLRSLSLKGADYYCSHCGAKGHRRHYCPDIPKSKSKRAYHCSRCGQAGHKRTNCHQVPQTGKGNIVSRNLIYKCSKCKETGHNARTCQKRPEK